MRFLLKNFMRLCLIALPLLSPAHSWAKKDYDGRQQQERKQGRGEGSIQQMEQDTGGTVLSSEAVERDGQQYQKMKILAPGGKVKTIYVPAR
jgi:hypothetical protein